MIGSKQLKIGMIIKHNGELWRVMQTQHTQPGKGGAFIQTKLRNILKGTQMDYRFRSGEPVEKVVLDQRQVQYLYADGDDYYFMDSESFEQFILKREQVEQALPYLIGDLRVMVEMYDGQAIGVELPKTVTAKIVDTEPHIKTATATNSYKGATLETGYTVQVPGFIEQGEVIDIDTETGQYLGRSK